MKPLSLSLASISPGTQLTEEGDALQYLHLPTYLDDYTSAAPELRDGGRLSSRARDFTQRVLEQLGAQTTDKPASALDLGHLPHEDRVALNRLLREGSVSILYTGARRVEIQLTVFAGIWRVRYYELGSGELAADMLEIGSVPRVVSVGSFPNSEPHWRLDAASLPPGVVSAPALLTDLLDRSEAYAPGERPYVLNLHQVPHGAEDMQFLVQSLGKGPVTVLSRARGHCRINSTRLPFVWWLQHYAAADSMILNTLEVIDVPQAVSVSPFDLQRGATHFAEALNSMG